MRQRLKEQARGARGMSVIFGLCMGVVSSLAVYSTVRPGALPFAIIASTGLIGFSIAVTNRRVEALARLLDSDENDDVAND